MAGEQSERLSWLARLRQGQRVLSIIGAAAFLAGYLLALITGLWFSESAALISILVGLGLVVGLVNVVEREIVPYLIAAIALIVIGNLQVFLPLNLVIAGLGDKLNEIVRMLAIFTAPAALIQAIRAGMVLARPGEAPPKQ